MQLVVDANVFIAAFVKDALTRELLLDERLKLATPEYGLVETEKVLKRPAVLRRLRLSREEFEALWSILTAPVGVIPQAEYQSFIKEARGLLDDPKDVPYLACALGLGVAVWSNDPYFQTPKIKSRAEIITTSELIGKLRH
ncbi:MAG: PIN domain-containing protein [Elusimicrobiota bacterium]